MFCCCSYFALFWDRVLQCSTGYLWIYSAAQIPSSPWFSHLRLPGARITAIYYQSGLLKFVFWLAVGILLRLRILVYQVKKTTPKNQPKSNKLSFYKQVCNNSALVCFWRLAPLCYLLVLGEGSAPLLFLMGLLALGSSSCTQETSWLPHPQQPLLVELVLLARLLGPCWSDSHCQCVPSQRRLCVNGWGGQICFKGTLFFLGITTILC